MQWALIYFLIKILLTSKSKELFFPTLYVKSHLELSNFSTCSIHKTFSINNFIKIFKQMFVKCVQNMVLYNKSLFLDLIKNVVIVYLLLEKYLLSICILFMQKKQEVMFQEESIIKEHV
jgi:hypothetical protein